VTVGEVPPVSVVRLHRTKRTGLFTTCRISEDVAVEESSVNQSTLSIDPSKFTVTAVGEPVVLTVQVCRGVRTPPKLVAVPAPVEPTALSEIFGPDVLFGEGTSADETPTHTKMRRAAISFFTLDPPSS